MEAEVRRILGRYLTEVIERFNLCPWARSARTSGELEIRVLFGTPSAEEVVKTALEILAVPTMRVGMIVFPEAPVRGRELRAYRDEILKVAPAGIADFHPDANYDALTPARLVSYLRRSPDPMLQLVPLAILDGVRTPTYVADAAAQLAMLDGTHPPVEDIGDRIAATNHATVTAKRDEVMAALDAIHEDRARSYPPRPALVEAD